MWHQYGYKDAPVNNLMVRSQLACSFQGPEIFRFPLRADGLAAIMKCLIKSYV